MFLHQARLLAVVRLLLPGIGIHALSMHLLGEGPALLLLSAVPVEPLRLPLLPPLLSAVPVEPLCLPLLRRHGV